MSTQIGTLIATHHELRLEIRSSFGTENELYGEAIQIRSQGKGTTEFAFDEYSDHYCLYHDLVPVGALTATRQACGNIDCREFYPNSLIQEFSNVITSFCKFRIVDSTCSDRLAAVRFMTRAIWLDQCRRGVRLDLINARRQLVPVYQRSGYTPIAGFDFIHPQLGTDSVVLFLAADPVGQSYFKDIFGALQNPLPKNAVLKSIRPN